MNAYADFVYDRRGWLALAASLVADLVILPALLAWFADDGVAAAHPEELA